MLTLLICAIGASTALGTGLAGSSAADTLTFDLDHTGSGAVVLAYSAMCTSFAGDNRAIRDVEIARRIQRRVRSITHVTVLGGKTVNCELWLLRNGTHEAYHFR